MTTIYKIMSRDEWTAAEGVGYFTGSGIDLADGFIHFSTAAQVAETAARHFEGRNDLVLVSVDARKLGAGVRFEPSRGGDLFPHLYGVLPLSTVIDAEPIERDDDGHHVFTSPEISSSRVS